MLEKNLEFCKAKGIYVREKRWFEPKILYSLQMSKFDTSITNLRLHFEYMDRLVNEFMKLYDEIAETAESMGEPFMARPNTDIDFSNLKQADKQISEKVRYFTRGSQRQDAYSDMYEAEKTMLAHARKKFLNNAIEQLPKDKSVVVFTTTRCQPYEKTIQRFWECVDNLIAVESKNIPILYMNYCPEWMAIRPSAYTEEELNKVLMNWGGIPNCTTVTYR